MKKEFKPGLIKNPKIEKESLEIEVTERQVIFLMLRTLKDGRNIYNEIAIDKAEIKEFFQEEL